MTGFQILVADDQSARCARIARLINTEPGLRLQGQAGDLTDAYNAAELHQPDLVILGCGMTQRAEFPMYRALLEHLGITWLVLGAPPVGTQPGDRLTDERTLLAAIHHRLGTGANQPDRPGAMPGPATGAGVARRAVVIGASTGGIEALLAVLGALPVDCTPTLVVQHIKADFLDGLARRLDRNCAARVALAQQGMALKAGHIYLAPDDRHHLTLRCDAALRCRLVSGEPVTGHRPSVDALFHSAAVLGGAAVGVLLTGMGRDGAEGLAAIRRAGGHTIVQNRETCTVYGMPRAAVELGAALRELPLDQIGPAVLAACRGHPAAVG